MESVKSFFRRALDALLLREDAYRAMRDGPNPVRRGLTFVVVIGLILGVAGLVGNLLWVWNAPDFHAIQEAVWDGMMEMPWRDEIPPDELDEVDAGMRQGFDTGWRIANMFIPTPAKALGGLITTPLGMLIGWLVFGLLAHGSARLLGGTGTLSQTYGTTALATAPRLFGVASVIPDVSTAGLGTWVLICTYVALKNTHGLSPGRTFWATVLPIVVLFVVIVGLAMAIAAAVAMGLAAVAS